MKRIIFVTLIMWLGVLTPVSSSLSMAATSISIIQNTTVTNSNEELFHIWSLGKKGFINKSGKIVIQPVFESIDEFSEGLARVKVGGVWGYINTSGKVIINPQFECADNFSEGLARVVKGNTYGYIDKTGKLVIDYKYSLPYSDGWLAAFHEGLAVVRINNKYGFMDRSERLVIPPDFDKAQPFSEGLACITVRNGSAAKMGYIDKKGTVVIQPQYSFASSFREQMARVEVITPAGKKYGYINQSGKLVIEPRFDAAYDFSEGLAVVGVGGPLIHSKKPGTIPYGCEMGGSIGGFPAGTKLGSGMYIDKSGKVVFEAHGSFTSDFSEGIAPIRFQTSAGLKDGFVDKKGHIVIEPQFEMASPFRNGLAEIRSRGNQAYINRAGQIVWQSPGW